MQLQLQSKMEMKAWPSWPRRLNPNSLIVASPYASPQGNPNSIRPGRLLVLGTGFVGRHVAQRLLRDHPGWHVAGTCTSPAKQEQLRSLGIEAHLFQLHEEQEQHLEALEPLLRDATHLLISIPPATGLNLHQHLHLFLNHANANLNLQWLSYLSSTSVYGDCRGAWVDEHYPVNPRTQSAISRYEAEKGWTDFGLHLGLSTFIFRLGGIYGPGRSALDTLLKRKDLSENQKRRDSRDFYYTARVHVADISQTILSSIEKPHLGKIYNVVDDDPAPRAEVFAYSRDLISRRYPEMTDKLNHLKLGDAQMIIGEKRVSNLRMKNELGVQLIYPSYKSGLQSILDSWSS
ncbi:NAD(P)-binding Rossmann-fold superfamily protein [Rhynchospora pubera]|uniref:NAD(P)-binding Rossmann-fold superfamily protein n=1 Tax=Rhynchospora pubera TaxID=906938 RepID=A0AAV8E146_9POAL|nr:NAD(P)-binding Rossmann-fold superfamily protein [Rhynchospora pubera]KAJ4779855.1 NAD(P)-binding Rossmann-fold superfamily protein [Rhynchospora pubera]